MKIQRYFTYYLFTEGGGKAASMLFNDLFSDISVKGVSSESAFCDFGSVCADSRKINNGDLFVCLSGTKDDGYRYLAEAAARGASAVVVERDPGDCPLPCIEVNSARASYARLMNNQSGRPTDKLSFFGVTGTNGKTSVSHLLRAILSGDGTKTALIGTVGGAMTTPDPDVLYPLVARLASKGIENVVMEASSHALALDKLDPITFEAGIFTNLTMDHGDFHKTESDYFEAKAKLFDRSKIAVLNVDDRYGRLLFDRRPSPETYGCSSADTPVAEADFSARSIVSSEKGTRYELVARNMIFRITTAMPWKFAIENTLLAASCALACGVRRECIQSGISSVQFISGRLERIDVQNSDGVSPRIYIDYAHTPDALENAISACRSIQRAGEKLTVLFGCGGDRDREKRPVMGRVAARGADRVIITSDNSRSEDPSAIIADIKAGVTDDADVTVIVDRREAILYALSTAEQNETILLAGKGHENYIINKEGRQYFSERDIVSEYYRSLR